MNVLRGLLFLGILAAVPVMGGGSAVAAILTSRGKIKVEARVLPAHTIIVDEQGVITRVYSNTPEEVNAPRVYRLSIEVGNEQPLTPALLSEYRRLVPIGESRVGVLYDKNSVFNLLEIPRLSLFPAHITTQLAFKNR